MINSCNQIKPYYKFLILIGLLIFSIPNVSGQVSGLISNSEVSPLIDGIIVTGEWDTLQPVKAFIQLQPQKGIEASESTIVYALYTDESICFAFECKQNQAITANIQTRDDVSSNDDAITVWLDTYLDQRTAFAFMVNPLGTQTDFRISDDGRNKNYEWDEEWKSVSKIYDWGWIVEIEIPFSSLKYKVQNNSWGFNFARSIASNNEQSWWSGTVSDNYRISQGSVLHGLQLERKSDILTLVPYTSLRYENSNITGTSNKIKPAIGGDIRWNISSNISTNVTIYPDFASVEGDKVKIDLSGWETDFPEKRIFFQEGNEMFSMRYPLFYSRRIGDIEYGTKVTGKTGPVSFNVLNVRSTEQDAENPAAFYTVARAKADVFKSSTLGVTVADKSEIDTNMARSFGLDIVMNPGENWKLTGQIFGNTQVKHNLKGGGFLRIAHESSKHHVHLRYTNLGKDLKSGMNQLGFLQDDDRHELDADLTYKFWLNDSYIKYLSLANMNNAYWTNDGELKGCKFRNQAKVYLQNKLSYQLYYDNRFYMRNVTQQEELQYEKEFYNHFLEHTLAYNSDVSSHAAVQYTHGSNFGRDMHILQTNITFQPIDKLNISYRLSWLNFSPDTLVYTNLRLEKSTLLNICTIDYYFNNNTWIRLFAQNDTKDERLYIYSQFGWRFKPPFGALFIIYSNDKYFKESLADDKNHETIFVKLTYPISF